MVTSVSISSSVGSSGDWCVISSDELIKPDPKRPRYETRCETCSMDLISKIGLDGGTVQPFDRFIPCQPNLNDEQLAHSLLLRKHGLGSKKLGDSSKELGDISLPYPDALSRALFGMSLETIRGSSILKFGDPKKPQNVSSRGVPVNLRLPEKPERRLDAPGLENDFYRSALDWSSNDLVAIVLGRFLFLYDVKRKKNNYFKAVKNRMDEFTAVCFLGNDYLIGGTNSGKIYFWNLKERTEIEHVMNYGRVITLAYCDCSRKLFAGFKNGMVTCFDLKQTTINSLENPFMNWLAHENKVCRVAFSPKGDLLATGGNDNVVKIWDLNNVQNQQPQLVTEMPYKAAVRAICWHPKRGGYLATGGGSADSLIKVWNARTGGIVASIRAPGQVCDLRWSPDGRYLAATIWQSGSSQQGITIYNCDLDKDSRYLLSNPQSIGCHRDRPLYMAQSPDGSRIITAAAGLDETLCFWYLFPKKPLCHRSHTLTSTNRLTIR